MGSLWQKLLKEEGYSNIAIYDGDNKKGKGYSKKNNYLLRRFYGYIRKLYL